jgi:6-phosphofructokinase
VIAAATIEAINNGLRVLGFKEGFKHLMSDSAQLVDGEQVQELTISDVSRIHFQGGSILRSSRSNPTKKAEHLQNVLNTLNYYGVKYLITIGGDDTAFSSMSIAKASGGAIEVVHVPKTIDNDLPLPKGIPTFGFQTAREFGTAIIRNLMEDAKTAARYFIVIAMGRSAGHLALSIGKSAGAHLTVIPEEFVQNGDKVTFKHICDVIEGTVLKRRSHGKDHGVVIVAEGVLEYMDEAELEQAFGKSNVQRDPHGHIMLAELDIGRLIRDEMRKRVSKHKHNVSFTEKYVGYELRCAPPNAFDREYTRDLGYGAMKFLLGENKPENLKNGALITMQGGDLVPMSFEDLKDKETGRARIRLVDTKGEGFQVAVKYMIRLGPNDFKNPDKLKRLSALSNRTEEEFRRDFEYLLHVHAH